MNRKTRAAGASISTRSVVERAIEISKSDKSSAWSGPVPKGDRAAPKPASDKK